MAEPDRGILKGLKIYFVADQSILPKEVRTAEQFETHLPNALELRVVRDKESVKLKLRTADYLYTLKTNEDEAQRIIKGVKELEIVEINSNKGKPVKEEEKSD